MIVSRSSKQLKVKLLQASKDLKRISDKEARFAMTNYISNVYRAAKDLNPPINLDFKTAFSSRKAYNLSIKRANILSDRMLDDFVLNKDFHGTFIEDVLSEKEAVENNYVEKDIEPKTYSPEEFSEILFDFLKSINQEELFDRIIEKGIIHNQRSNRSGNRGSILYNPVNGDTDILIRKFQYTLPDMNVIVHELGHALDYQIMGIDPQKFNYYFYVSFMDEVISNLFEKLFIDYAIRHNLEYEIVQNMLFNYDIDYFYSQFNAFLLSTLSDEDLYSDKFLDLDSKGFYRLFKDYFDSQEEADEHLALCGDIDLESVYGYSYGNIISTFLADEIRKNGFDNLMLADFLRNRYGKFDRDLFERNDWTPKKFGKIYRKELEILSK